MTWKKNYIHKWYLLNRERLLREAKEERLSKKLTVLFFLTVDHKLGREKGDRTRGEALYRKILKFLDYENYQALCWNCNYAKGYLGDCPCQP